MSPRTYVTAARVAQLEAQLSERDSAIVATLDRTRVASGAQLQRVHFVDGTARSRQRRSELALNRLVDRRVLARLDRRVGGVRAGSAGYVYALDAAGQRLASVCGPAGGRRLRRPWTPGAAFVAHALAVTELYVGLREAERAGGLELVAFDAEPLCWRTFTGLGGARVVLKPDAFVRVGLGEFEDCYFVEVDRATQSAPAIARKLTVYRRYFQTGREQARFGVFPEVLLLVPTEKRRAALVEVAAAQPAGAWPLFQVARYADARAIFAGEAQ